MKDREPDMLTDKLRRRTKEFLEDMKERLRERKRRQIARFSENPSGVENPPRKTIEDVIDWVQRVRPGFIRLTTRKEVKEEEAEESLGPAGIEKPEETNETGSGPAGVGTPARK